MTVAAVNKRLVNKMYREYTKGASKNQLERDYLGDTRSNGKKATQLFRSVLGIETERVHPLAAENARLRFILKKNGIKF